MRARYFRARIVTGFLTLFWVLREELARGKLARGKLERGKLERGKLARGKLERGKLERGKLERGKLAIAGKAQSKSKSPLIIGWKPCYLSSLENPDNANYPQR